MKSARHWLSVIVVLTSGVANVPEARAEDPFGLFKKLDANRDKRLSEDEFVGETTGAARTKARKRFRSLDKNYDKSLSYTEFKGR